MSPRRLIIEILADPQGGYRAQCLALPKIVNWGDTPLNAFDITVHAVECYVANMQNHGERVPWEDEVKTPPPIHKIAEVLM